MNPILVAGVYAVVGVAVPPIVFYLSRTPFSIIDVAAASLAGALVSLLPTIGGPASLLAMLLILYWRMKDAPMIVAAAVGIARLAMVPVLVLFR